MSETAPSPGLDDADLPIEGRVAGALRWSFAQQILGRFTSVVSGIVLARILVPEDFGVFAVALAVVNVLFGLNDLGMLLAVVRWSGDLRHAARTAATLAVGASIGLYGLCFLGAPMLARSLNSPDSAWVLRVLALTVLIDGITTVPNGLLHRALRQDRLAIAEFGAIPVGVTVSIVTAAAGAGPWSLALGQLAGSVTSGTLILSFAPFVPRLGFDRAVARSMLAFGLPLAGTSMLEYLLFNADYIVVGRVLGPVQLGLYLLAYNVSGWPVTVLTAAIRRVSIVGFARLDHDGSPSLVRSFERTFVVLVTLAIPISLCLGVFADELVRTVYGERWSTAATVLRYLAVLGLVRVVVGYVFDLLIGLGRSRTTLKLKGIWLTVLIPALVSGAHLDGIRGVAVAHLVVGVTVALPLFLRAAFDVGVDPARLRRGCMRPLAGLGFACATAWAVLAILEGDAPRLLVGSTAVIISYAVVALPLGAIRRHGASAILDPEAMR